MELCAPSVHLSDSLRQRRRDEELPAPFSSLNSTGRLQKQSHACWTGLNEGVCMGLAACDRCSSERTRGRAGIESPTDPSDRRHRLGTAVDAL